MRNKLLSLTLLPLLMASCSGVETITYCDANCQSKNWPACEGTIRITELWDNRDGGWETYDYSFEKEGKKVVGIVTYGYGSHHHYRVTYR